MEAAVHGDIDRRCLYNIRKDVSKLEEYFFVEVHHSLHFISERTDFIAGFIKIVINTQEVKMPKALTMLAVGDLILGGPEPDSAFVLAASILGAADIPVGQGEVPLNYMNGSER